MASIDKLRASDGSGNASVATVQSTRSGGASTIIVDTVQGINTNFYGTMGTPHTFTDPITSETITVISEATAVDFQGHVDGSNLEIDVIAPGYTDNGSAVGDIVIIRPTTQWADEVADVLDVVHEDTGQLKSGSANRAINPEQGFMINGKIVRSVASNNLTVAIKTLAGADPSTTDPVYVRIGDTVRSITAALSITINAGTNWWGMGASYFVSTDQDFFAYLIWNTTDSAVTIAVAREPDMRIYSDRNATSTNHGYLVSSGSAPASTDEMEVVGRFNATLGASASYNWSLPATAIVINRPIFETRTFSFTNSGTAGGTHYIKQVGSVKRLWGASASFSTSTATTNVIVTFPVGYFAAVESCVGSPRSVASFATQYFTGNGISTTQWAYYIFTISGSASATAGIEVIGS